MAFIDIDFDSVPNKYEQVPAGVYICTIERAEKKPTKDGTSQKVEVELQITDGPMTGRKVFDHIGLKGTPIQLKRLIMAAGLTAGKGFDLSDLIGKTVKIRTKAGTYKDPESGEVKETVRLGDYLIDSESSGS